MFKTVSQTETPNASRYLQQLCKHWNHKFNVTFDPSHGKIEFGDDKCATMAASDTRLDITVTAPTRDATEKLAQVVADHLDRFAHRETIQFDWAPVIETAG